MQKMSNITIRGTKEGLILILDDQCSFSDLLTELEEKLSSNFPKMSHGPSAHVKVSVGNRYLLDEQIEMLQKVISEKQKLVVNQIDSNVMTKLEAKILVNEARTTTLMKVIRSGQVIQIEGDLLLLGDVNPGGTVMATGNIYILGVLRGIAHAGCTGNRDAIISASKMEPSQLRIAEIVSRSPDKIENDGHEMECAYIGEDNQIAIERIQYMGKIRPHLTTVSSES